jgi:hypothetical protein
MDRSRNASGKEYCLICKVCGKISNQIFKRKILDKYVIAYFQCSSCEFIQTEEPYWLEEAYRHSLNIEDTGIIKRNILCAKRTSVVLYSFFNHLGRFLDYGGGTGLFVRLMRDYGYNFYWNDPFTTNIFARGYEYDNSLSPQYEAVTSFECFEHFVDPPAEIKKMLSLAPAIVFSTEIFTGGTPSPDSWKYYYFSHGQHVSLYSLKSLQRIAQEHHLHLLTNKKSFHLLSPVKTSSLVFQALLKASVLGLPSVITALQGTKTKSDSQALTHEK